MEPKLEEIAAVSSAQKSGIIPANQIMKNIRENNLVFYDSLFTSHLALYSIEDNAPIMYLIRDFTKMFNDVTEVSKGLLKEGHYYPSAALLQKLTLPKNSLRTDISKIRLKKVKFCDNIGNLLINTTHFSHLNDNERDLAEAVYGRNTETEKNFEMIMKMLHERKINETTISLFKPEYVIKKFNEAGPFLNACALFSIEYGSNFVATGRVLLNPNKKYAESYWHP